MSVKNAGAIVMLSFVTLLTGGCGTTKNFTIDSNPKGASIVIQPKQGFVNVQGVSVLRDVFMGKTPVTTPITFCGEDAKIYALAEKRGYESSTVELSKDSDPAVMFNLKKIDGVSDEVSFRKENLLSRTFTLLPAYMEVVIHSGVGRLDKKEYSAELSKKVTEDLNAELEKSLKGNTKQVLRPVILDGNLVKDWTDLSLEINKYLFKLEPKKLAYYSLPPYVSTNVGGFSEFVDSVKKQNGANPYLLYISAKCVSETAGRKVGNVLLDILGASMKGINPSFYYDPSAFSPDSGTLVTMYVIDAVTSEVLYIDQHVFPDVTDADDLKNMISAISAFPDIDTKKE